jgi:hypothetical protein
MVLFVITIKKSSIFMDAIRSSASAPSPSSSTSLKAAASAVTVGGEVIPRASLSLPIIILPPLSDSLRLPLNDKQLTRLRIAFETGGFKQGHDSIKEIGNVFNARLSNSRFHGISFKVEDSKTADEMLKNARLCQKIVKKRHLDRITILQQELVASYNRKDLIAIEEPSVGTLDDTASQEELERTYETMQNSPALQAEVIEFFRQLAVLICKTGNFAHPWNGALRSNPCHLTLFGCTLPKSRSLLLLLNSAPVEAWPIIFKVAKHYKHKIAFPDPELAHQQRALELAARSRARKWHTERRITSAREYLPAVIERTPDQQAALSYPGKILDAIARSENYRHFEGSLVSQRSVHYPLTVVNDKSQIEFEAALESLNSLIPSWTSKHSYNPNGAKIIIYTIYF